MMRQRHANLAEKFCPLFCLTFIILCIGHDGAKSQTHARTQAKVVPFSKSAAWNIQAVFDPNGAFSHCSAVARYASGTQVSIIFEREGRWLLRFFNRSWPNRKFSTFPSRIQIDGRNVFNGQGFFRAQSAYIILGRELKRVTALMRGLKMTVFTASGSTSFRLDGTYRATVSVARCLSSNVKQPGGAFAGGVERSPNIRGGAFGGTRKAPGALTSRLLSRGNTLDLAARYLSIIQQPYTILPVKQNVLRGFPVNWKFSNGRYGGMRAYAGSKLTSVQELNRLLALHAANCRGSSATKRESPLRLKNGNLLQRARAVCETNSGVNSLHYHVAKLTSSILVVVVHFDLEDDIQNSDPAIPHQRREPAPNEL